jgi:hypothetical protein
MSLFLDSFWRAVFYCLHPRVILLSLLPLVLMIALAGGLGYFFWDSAVNSVFTWLESSDWLEALARWLQEMGFGNLKNALAPLLVIFAITPLLVVVVLFLVAVMMMPAIVNLVARRRFPDLERRKGASFFVGALWSFGSTLLALIALVVSLPLWLILPLVLIVPPLIWGWLTYRVMAFDALAEHASSGERRDLLREHRMPLLLMGVGTGYMGAAPSLVWASGWFFAAAFPLLIPVAIWIYTLVFAFSSLWFAHYCLAALEQLRARTLTPSAGELARIEPVHEVPQADVERRGGTEADPRLER